MMHSYTKFLNYLESLQENKIKPGLDRISMACELLGHPEREFRSVHIAGTNGKGSTAAFLESIVRMAGYSVGLYTSPHLQDVRERIQIDRKWINESDVSSLSDEVLKKCSDIGLSYFEFLTAISLLHFAREQAGLSILETGLGGRWDATNVVNPLVTIMTPISVDHTSYLGDDIKSIALEKCGIIKPGVPLICSVQHGEVMKIIEEKCAEVGASLIAINSPTQFSDLGLEGQHQAMNASLAVRAAELLSEKCDFNIINYEQPLKETIWPGRLQTISTNPEILLDGAHNPEACEALSKYIKEKYSGRDIVFIFGAMRDKNLSEMLKPLLEIASGWVAYKIDCSRALEPGRLKELITSHNVYEAKEPQEALQKALSKGFKNPLIVACGSLYLVGEFLKEFG
jgi:dihydrofolate synthase/folylpolyglutamate synthase